MAIVRPITSLPCAVQTCLRSATHEVLCVLNRLVVGRYCRMHAARKRLAVHRWEAGPGAVHHGVVDGPFLSVIDGDAATLDGAERKAALTRRAPLRLITGQAGKETSS